MPSVLYSTRAKADLFEIRHYSVRNWGAARTARHLRDLGACCERLAKMPRLGRKCDFHRAGLMRMEQGSHVIFYRIEGDGILALRILHKTMLPEQNFPGSSDDPLG